MKFEIRRSLPRAMAALFLFLFVASGCASPRPSQSTSATPPVSSGATTPLLTSQAGETPPQEPISVDVFFPDVAPALNQTAELRAVVTSRLRDQATLSLSLDLPVGFQLVSGNASWTGSVGPASETVAIDVVIKSLTTGNFTLIVRSREVSFLTGEGTHIVYLSVNETSAAWGRVPPWIGPPSPVTVTRSSE